MSSTHPIPAEQSWRLDFLAGGGEMVAAPRRDRDEATKATVVPKRILLVDDNVDAADTLSLMLRFDGHETHVVYTGTDVLDQVETFRPDVILLDEDRARALREGVDAHLVKPVNLDELSRVLAG